MDVSDVAVETESLEATPPLSDDTSPSTISVYWDETIEEARRSDLRAVVKNAAEIDLQADLELAGRGVGESAIYRKLRSVKVPARSAVYVNIALGDLPAQSTTSPTTFAVVAKYVDTQGVAAQETSAPRYAIHGAGFKDALVRDGATQGRAARAAFLGPVPAASPPRGKVFDPSSGLLADKIALDGAGAAEAIVVGESGFADVDDTEPGVELPFDDHVAPEARDAIPKAASYKFCARWQYAFRDQGRGEDHLKHYNGLNHGGIAAAYNWFNLKLGSTTLFSGYMDASGCTPTLSLSAGTYRYSVTPAASRAGTFLWVHPTSNQTFRYFFTDVSVTGSGPGLLTRYFDFGLNDPVAAAGALTTHLIKRSDLGLKPVTYRVYAETGCPGLPGSACYVKTSNAVHLGKDNFGNFKAFSKFLVAHELGHAVAQNLFGSLSQDFTDSATQAVCRCDHVVSSNDLHCMQSREFIAAAQQEGWGQFYGATLLNVASQSDCVHAYYKEFMNTAGTITSPPVTILCSAANRWLEKQCLASGRGTELDWMNFYWEVNTKTTNAFSVTQLSDVYRQGCAGTCSGANLSFANLVSAVTTLHGATSTKRQHWVNTGTRHGVDN